MQQSNQRFSQVIIGSVLTALFLILIQVNGFAQTKANNYEKEWAAINKQEYDGLTKSALAETQKLYEKIQKDNKNPVQIGQSIKALLFINKYQARLEEDGLVKAIYRFQEEADKAKVPIKPILQSMVAEMYNNYLQQHLYKFQDRSTTVDFEQEDIRTWDVARITNKCYELYRASIQFEETKTIKIDDFGAVTNRGMNAEGLRPTLYDFLVHRALDFFISDMYYLTKPAYKFYLDNNADFADAKSFAARKLVARDSLSAQFQALLLFQKGLAFHESDDDPKAWINLDLKRLDFVRSKSILNDKDLLYLERLEALYKKYEANEVAAEIAYKIALHYNEQGSKYQPSPTDQYRWDIKKAYELCEKAVQKFPKSYGASHCEALMNTIKNKSIRLNTEKINSIQKPILGLITYKNLNKVYFKAIPVTKEQYASFNSKYGKDRVAFLNTLSGAYKWSIDLKDEGDFQMHSVEFAIPSLKNGRYILVSSDNEAFTITGNGIAYTMFFVSNMSLSQRQENGIGKLLHSL